MIADEAQSSLAPLSLHQQQGWEHSSRGESIRPAVSRVDPKVQRKGGKLVSLRVSPGQTAGCRHYSHLVSIHAYWLEEKKSSVSRGRRVCASPAVDQVPPALAAR